MDAHKAIHSLVLDAGPIIKNDPAVSSLLKQTERLYTVPAIISEIKDSQTRSRVTTTLLPFLTIQSPTAQSLKIVTDFARRTGDLVVLSRPDIEIIALTYDLECERNQGNWRLRSVPGQKKLNGAPPSRTNQESTDDQSSSTLQTPNLANLSLSDDTNDTTNDETTLTTSQLESRDTQSAVEGSIPSNGETIIADDETEFAVQAPNHELVSSSDVVSLSGVVDASQSMAEDEKVSDSDSEGWITPSNLKQQQAKDAASSTTETPEPSTMQAAVLTSDFAMQNVILQMNLNLLSSSMQRVKHLKTFILRCHACFTTTKDMNKQFCQRCGQATLTRVSCSTNAKGEFKLHLKSNMQWNTRGDRFAIPKPAHGSANRRVTGGGKGGWGHDLILAEDQKEYERARVVERRQKERSLMDEDYLPSILTGDRSKGGGRIKVGAGRNINSRKR